MALLLFREFIEILNFVDNKGGIEYFEIYCDNFLKHYKQCNIDIQGEFHELVSAFMKNNC